MNLLTYFVISVVLIGSVACGKLKLVAFKGPHAGFLGVKVRTPKLLGLKKHHGLGGGFGGGFHKHHEHHEYHSSWSKGGSFGWFGK